MFLVRAGAIRGRTCYLGATRRSRAALNRQTAGRSSRFLWSAVYIIDIAEPLETPGSSPIPAGSGEPARTRRKSVRTRANTHQIKVTARSFRSLFGQSCRPNRNKNHPDEVFGRDGCASQVARQLARHGTTTLTMDRYTHTVMGELSDALAALPDLTPEKTAPNRSARRALVMSPQKPYRVSYLKSYLHGVHRKNHPLHRVAPRVRVTHIRHSKETLIK
jgi:hypothetical protein